MNDPLQMRVLEAVGAGHRTLDDLCAALAASRTPVDERIRSAIAQGLLVPHQRGERWTFSLTDEGHRAIASQNRLATLAGLGARLGEIRTGQQLPKQPGTPGTFGPAARVIARASKRPVSTRASMLTPEQEAAEAERQSWMFAAGAVGAVVFVVLVVALLLAL